MILEQTTGEQVGYIGLGLVLSWASGESAASNVLTDRWANVLYLNTMPDSRPMLRIAPTRSPIQIDAGRIE